ncbi:MAG: diguanylate cyclase [Gemmiger sp.]|nr:diguanylate cyclase [Gemmiger sp.]
MKQAYSAAELCTEISALQAMFDTVKLVNSETMQYLNTETMQPTGACHSLPPLDEQGRGWRPTQRDGRVELAFYQAFLMEGRHYLLVAAYCLPQTVPENSRDANAFLRILSQYNEEMRHDYVTGTYNHRYLNEEYLPKLAAAVAAGRQVSVALARVNEYGHICAECSSDAADRCLNTAAGILQIAAGMDPEKGILARLEDGVFVVTALDTTPAQLEKTLREALENSRKDYNISLSRRGEFTVTVATADWAETGNWDLLLALAERRMAQQ